MPEYPYQRGGYTIIAEVDGSLIAKGINLRASQLAGIDQLLAAMNGDDECAVKDAGQAAYCVP